MGSRGRAVFNKYLLGAAGAAIVGAFFWGTQVGGNWCEARQERERQKTQEEVDDVGDDDNRAGQDLLVERQIFMTRERMLLDEINRLADSCRVDDDWLRRFRAGGWDRG